MKRVYKADVNDIESNFLERALLMVNFVNFSF